MNTARGNYNSLFARPAADASSDDDDPTGTVDEPAPLIDLTLLDAVYRGRRRGPVTPLPASRRSLWLAVRPVVTDATRCGPPPGLFLLTAPAARAHR